jgi:hypothetical protein
VNLSRGYTPSTFEPIDNDPRDLTNDKKKTIIPRIICIKQTRIEISLFFCSPLSISLVVYCTIHSPVCVIMYTSAYCVLCVCVTVCGHRKIPGWNIIISSRHWMGRMERRVISCWSVAISNTMQRSWFNPAYAIREKYLHDPPYKLQHPSVCMLTSSDPACTFQISHICKCAHPVINLLSLELYSNLKWNGLMESWLYGYIGNNKF